MNPKPSKKKKKAVKESEYPVEIMGKRHLHTFIAYKCPSCNIITAKCKCGETL